MLILFLSSVGVKFETQLFISLWILWQKNLYRINCCFLDLIFLARIDLCYFHYLEMVNSILVLKLWEFPLVMFLRLDYEQTSSAICNKTSSLNSRFHISDLYKSNGLFNFFGNETIPFLICHVIIFILSIDALY